ncbi:hypothetical protein Tco_0794193 [Tanacetum coccineum]
MWHWLMITCASLKEIEKMVDGQENDVDDISIHRNDESNIPSTRIEPKSNKKSPEVEITKDVKTEIVSLNLLSRTRKFSHSTMEIRSLIS